MKKLLQILLSALNHRLPINPHLRYVGIIFTMTGWFLLGLSTIIFQKAYSESPLFVNYFFQFLSLFLIVLICTLKFKGWKYIYPKRPGLVTTRCILAVLTYYAYFAAKVGTEIIDNSILFSTDAIWVALFIFACQGKINWKILLGILIGFLGVCFVYSFDIYVHSLRIGLIGLSSGIGLAAIVILQSLMMKTDPPLRVALHQGFWGVLLTLPLALYYWEIPSLDSLLLMIFAGLFFSAALFMFLDAFYFTEIHIIAVLGYSLTVFVELLNWIMNGTTTQANTIVGTFLVVLGGLFVIYEQYKEDHLLRKN